MSLSHVFNETWRIINEYDLIREILSQYSLQKVDKFVQEVFWRVYWKGWLEHRPEVWKDFVISTPSYSDEDYEKAINVIFSNIFCLYGFWAR